MNQKNAKTTEKMLALEQSIYGISPLIGELRLTGLSGEPFV